MEELLKINAHGSFTSAMCLAKLNTVIALQEEILAHLKGVPKDEIVKMSRDHERRQLMQTLDSLPQPIREAIDMEELKQNLIPVETKP